MDFNFNPDLNDPKTQLLVSMGLSLMGGNPRTNRNVGADLAYAGANGLGAFQNARQFQLEQQAQERANRANDLQTAVGLYSALKQADLTQQIQDEHNGVPHVRNPALSAVESKMSELAGIPGLAGTGPGLLSPSQGAPVKAGAGLLTTPSPNTPTASAAPNAANVPAGSPGAPYAPSLLAPQTAPQSAGTVPARPVGQNFMGANPNYQPLPPPRSTAIRYNGDTTPQSAASNVDNEGQPPAPSSVNPGQGSRTPGGPPTTNATATAPDLGYEADLYAAMSNRPDLIAENRYKRSLPTFSRGVAFDSGTGQILGGMVDNVPVYRDPTTGAIRVMPNDIQAAIANRAGAVAGAQAAASSQYKTVPFTDASGATNPRFLPNVPGYPNAQPSPIPGASPSGVVPGGPNPNVPAIPPAVLAAARSGSPFVATQAAAGGPVQFQTPPSAANAGNAQPGSWWPDMPKVQPMQVGAGGQSTYAKGIAERQAAAAEKLSEELGTNAASASNRIAVNNQALEVVNKADTGWMANHLADFRNVLATLAPAGSDLAKSAADQAATDQVLSKDLVSTALQRGKQLFGSRFTQSEVGIMLSRAAPSPEQQKAAIKFLLESDNAIQGYAVQQASDFGRYYQSGGDPLLFKGAYAKKFPVTDALSKVQLGQSAAPALPATSVYAGGKVYNFPSPEAAARFRAHVGAQ